MSESLARWLELREPFDHASRSEHLARAVADALPRGQRVRVLDLGSGTGSNMRYLARFLPGDQEWLLTDKDPVVLARAGDGLQTIPFQIRKVDLGSRPAGLVEGRDLVTASALLDLVSDSFLIWLAERCRDAGSVALFALTYTGRSTCTPHEPEDDEVCALLNRHQRQSDKGFGPAAGPDAVVRAADAFASAGYRVERAASDWAIPSDAREMQRMLIQGWADAALDMAPAEGPRIAEWLARRLGHVDAGRSHIVVTHEDLAAFPIRSRA